MRVDVQTRHRAGAFACPDPGFEAGSHRAGAAGAGVLAAPAVSTLTSALCPQCTCGGVLRGSGNQRVGAIVNTIGYYVVGLPIGISLMFATGLGVVGKPRGWEFHGRSRRLCTRRGSGALELPRSFWAPRKTEPVGERQGGGLRGGCTCPRATPAPGLSPGHRDPHHLSHPVLWQVGRG